MQYKEFTIKNFKGIQDINLKFDSLPLSPIVTLVGLNESGKTTILEALDFFYASLDTKGEITIQPSKVSAIHSLIPKRLRDNFNGQIIVEAVLTLDEADYAIIFEESRSHNFRPTKIGDDLTIRHTFSFKNSRFEENHQNWDIFIKGKKLRGKIELVLDENNEAWLPILDALEVQIPPIIYYRNFLFDFPDRIYLEEIPKEKQKEMPEQEFYRRLIQDILDSLKNDLTIKDHLVERAKSLDDSDLDALESVINKMSSSLGKVAFDPKLSVFGHSSTTRSIRISHPKKDEVLGIWYLEIKIKDGDDTFFIRERSLGFRWFFAFLIFTQFRVQRIEGLYKPLFLFDEPASNLHQTAQHRLLRAFEGLTNTHGTKIVYTTHSHHLIEPKWLEGAYIVKNQALSYDDDTDYTNVMTDISVHKYRVFVSSYPDQRTYFQPILDVLDYRPSNLELIPNIIMLEGKNDFYTIAYMNDVVLDNSFNLNFLPGGGAGSLDSAIQLYYAWGRDFHVLLDSDKEGDRQKGRYINKFGRIIEERVHTLEDIVPEFTDFDLEDVFDSNDYLKIQAIIDPSLEKFNKPTFNLAIQECLICKRKIEFTPKTIENFEKLIGRLFELINQHE